MVGIVTFCALALFAQEALAVGIAQSQNIANDALGGAQNILPGMNTVPSAEDVVPATPGVELKNIIPNTADGEKNTEVVPTADTETSNDINIFPAQVYTSPIDLQHGNLTVGPAAAVTKNVHVASGNVTLESNSRVDGNITIDDGALIVGPNATVEGAVKVAGNVSLEANAKAKGIVNAGSLRLGPNASIAGLTNVFSTNTIILGSNASINGTLTSKAGLRADSNAVVRLFLSGGTTEIDGKTYQLGGKIVTQGANAKIGMPFMPNRASTNGTSTEAEASDTDASSMEDGVTSSETEAGGTVTGESPLLPSIDNLLTMNDIESFTSDVVKRDTNIGNLNLSPDVVSVDYKTPAKLFGFIPAAVSAHIEVAKDATYSISYPWYSFLFSTSKQEVEDNVSSALKDVVQHTATDGGQAAEEFSVKLQATIAHSVLSVLQNMFR